MLYDRYMDDILREIRKDHIDTKLEEINNLHPKLEFTVERETNMSIPFLDMLIIRDSDKLSSTWYTKHTDTGLTMNFQFFVPLKYKRYVIIGFVHRIFRACST